MKYHNRNDLNILLVKTIFAHVFVDQLLFNDNYTKKIIQVKTKEDLDLIIKLSQHFGFKIPEYDERVYSRIHEIYFVFNTDSTLSIITDMKKEASNTKYVRIIVGDSKKDGVIYNFVKDFENFVSDQMNYPIDFTKRKRKYYLELDNYNNYRIRYCYKRKDNVFTYFTKKQSLENILKISKFKSLIIAYLKAQKRIEKHEG